MITLQLVRTCFSNSTGLLITQQAVNRFTRDADDSPDVPKLVGRYYADFRLTKSDWEKMGLMHEVLRVRDNVFAFNHFSDLISHAIRKQQTLINLFHLLKTLQSGEQSLCWNSYKKPGQARPFTTSPGKKIIM